MLQTRRYKQMSYQMVKLHQLVQRKNNKKLEYNCNVRCHRYLVSLQQVKITDERNFDRQNEIGPGFYDPHEVNYIKAPIKRSQPVLKPSQEKVLATYFSEMSPVLGEPKILPPVIQNQRNRTESQAGLDSPRHRLLVKKVSKVSILSTTRKIEKTEVSTLEKLIPIFQNSLSTLSNTQKKLSSNFISNVQREIYPRKENQPGPGEYYNSQNQSSTRVSQSLNKISQNTNKNSQISFGTSKDRNIVYLKRDISCPFQDKSQAPDVGKYTRNESKLSKNKQVKTTLAGGVDIHKPILKSEMAKNYIFAKQFYSNPDDGKLVSTQKQTDVIPGPGAYNPDYPATFATAQNTDKKQIQSPFGSNELRFKQIKNGVVTDQQLREQELQEDMYDHTKVRKKSPAERKNNQIKPVAKHHEKQVTASGLSKQEELVQEFVKLVEQHIPQPLRHQNSQKSIKPLKQNFAHREVIQLSRISDPVPGPGAYQLPRAKTNGPSFGKAPRQKIFQNQNDYTGPADYQVLETLERKSFNRRL